ncbi:MAG: hypothetical protein GC192_11570 [Bacteroidetes bacterium]|nr:hypothetical protein [Bacteroidota bacterium]
MKFSPLLFLLFFAVGCFSQTGQTKQPEVPSTDASLANLRWTLNDLLTMQLPSTYPDSLNGKTYRKSFSMSLPRADSNQVIEVQELRKTTDKDSIFGGSKYRLPLKDLDIENLRIITSLDEKYTAVIIPAKKGISFTQEPFGNEPGRKVTDVTIGWYDRVQDRTLARAYVAWKQFLVKWSKEQE